MKSWREARLEEQKLAKLIAEHNAVDLDAYLRTRKSDKLLSPELMKAAFREFLAQDKTNIISAHNVIGVLHDYIRANAQYAKSADHKIMVELCVLYERKAVPASMRETALKYDNKIKMLEEKRAEIKGVLDKHLVDRKVASTKEFSRAGKKETGVSGGYVAKRKEDKHTFMLKAAAKTAAQVTTDQQRIDRRDFVNEYVMAPLYRRMLFNRAPIFELTTENKIDSKKYGTPKSSTDSSSTIYGRSKFFDEFKVLGEFAGSGNFNIISNHPNLKKIEGFEKVIAACLFAGELDYHSGNLGVVSKIGDDGKMHHTIVKIDHGRSAIKFSTNDAKLINSMIEGFLVCEYTNIPFNVKKFKEAIDEMGKISDQEIENMIESRFDVLTRNGFSFAGMKIGEIVDGKPTITTVSDDSKESIQKLKQRYIKLFKQQRDVLIQLSARLEVIADIDFKTAVVNPILAVKDMNPLVYAIEKGLTIGGMAPLEYATKHDKISSELLMYAIDVKIQINGEDPLEYAHKHNKVDDKMVLWAISNNQKIDGRDPMHYAAINNLTITDLTDLTFKVMPAIAYAIKHDLTIDGKDAVEYAYETLDKLDSAVVTMALRKSKLIGGKHPVAYAIENKILINANMDPVKYALFDANIKIDDMSGIEYVVHNNLMNIDALLFAAEKKLQIAGKPAIIYAIENKDKFPGFDAVKHAIQTLPPTSISRLIQGENKIEPSIESLSFLLEAYLKFSAHGLSTLKLEAEFNRVQTALNNGKEVLKADSKLGQFLNSAPSFIIAEKLGASPEKLSSGRIEEDLMTGCSLDVLARVAKVTKHIDTGLGQVPITYYLHMFVDCIKNISGAGATDANVLGAAKDLKALTALKSDKQVAGSFAGKLEQAREDLQFRGLE